MVFQNCVLINYLSETIIIYLKNPYFLLHSCIKIMAQNTNISKFIINVNVSNNAKLTITYTMLNIWK